jgi:hypothetical protein
VTGDALHTQRDHARFLVEVKKAHYALTVKRNQKNLHEQMRTLPWGEATATFYERTQGHGRKETRVVQVLTVTDLGVDFHPFVQHPSADVAVNYCRQTTARPRRRQSPAGSLRYLQAIASVTPSTVMNLPH